MVFFFICTRPVKTRSNFNLSQTGDLLCCNPERVFFSFFFYDVAENK